MRALIVALLVLPTRTLLPHSCCLRIGPKVAAGQYGAVHFATFDGTPAIAKCAKAANEEDLERARKYLAVEQEVYEAIQDSGDEEHFTKYLGTVEDDGREPWIAWEMLACGARGQECAETLDVYAGRPAELQAAHGLSPRAALRQLLECVAALHRIGYLHRDIKPANVLVATAPSDGAVSSLKLIDMGSCAFAAGCSVAGSSMRSCTDLDPSTSPCSVIYAPPEQFADEEHPWAFDVYSAAICYLRLTLRCLETDEKLRGFRGELADAGGGFPEWLAAKLEHTAREDPLVDDLSAAFPDGGFALVSAMLDPDPAARPSVEALLSHPFIRGARDVAGGGGADADAEDAVLIGGDAGSAMEGARDAVGSDAAQDAGGGDATIFVGDWSVSEPRMDI